MRLLTFLLIGVAMLALPAFASGDKRPISPPRPKDNSE
jgi:hypothetical protein